MSTEHQQYSLEGQSAAIRAYAAAHGFEIVKTYSDSARSGVVLTRRTGLQNLLQDVVRGESDFKVILVYDVSRWGRFQDTDEAAHYEFICRSAGVPIHYCAETFVNDGTLTSLIMKSLKRAMAAEYVRELGDKVLAGQKRLARLGFKQGGPAGFGLRRMLIGPDGLPKGVLKFGERKSIATDRVILVPGPATEVEWVRKIFGMLIAETHSVCDIARVLNRAGVPYYDQTAWDYQRVHQVLTHPKYWGCHAFNKTTRRLYTKTVKTPSSHWVLTPGAFEPIVDRVVFDRAQVILRSRTHHKSNQQVLDELRAHVALTGRLSLSELNRSSKLPSPSTIRHRFGSLREAYTLIGYGARGQFDVVGSRQQNHVLRTELFARIVAASGRTILPLQTDSKRRARLRLPNRVVVSVILARYVGMWKGAAVRWVVEPAPQERHLSALVARLNEKNNDFMDFHVFSRIDRRGRFFTRLDDPWLKTGRKIVNLSELCDAVASIRRECA